MTYSHGSPIARELLGGTAQAWENPVKWGDGNLNRSDHSRVAQAAVVKQALPYVPGLWAKAALAAEVVLLREQRPCHSATCAGAHAAGLSLRQRHGAHRHGIPHAAHHLAQGADPRRMIHAWRRTSRSSWRGRCSTPPMLGPPPRRTRRGSSRFASTWCGRITEDLAPSTDPTPRGGTNRLD